MIDHLSLKVRDLGRSKAFYVEALAPLGAAVQMEYGGGCGLGPPGKPVLWLAQGDPPSSPVHLAFAAPDRRAVDAFHAAALGGGASDNGPPGLRQEYHPSYYAAFVIDPDGHNVEAVCHVEAPAEERPDRRAAPRGPRRAGKGTARKGGGAAARASARTRKQSGAGKGGGRKPARRASRRSRR